jgi:hypothetical protein
MQEYIASPAFYELQRRLARRWRREKALKLFEIIAGIAVVIIGLNRS